MSSFHCSDYMHSRFGLLALVAGFANLPSVMIPDSAEVLFELMDVAREVSYRIINLVLRIRWWETPHSQCRDYLNIRWTKLPSERAKLLSLKRLNFFQLCPSM